MIMDNYFYFMGWKDIRYLIKIYIYFSNASTSIIGKVQGLASQISMPIYTAEIIYRTRSVPFIWSKDHMNILNF